MKNVLYHYSSQQIHTGSPRVLMGVVEGLDRASFAPYFLAQGDGDLSRELGKRGCGVLRGRSGQLSLHSLPQSLLNLSRLASLLLKNRVSLVHLNELGWNSELALAAKLVGIPVFFHIHNPVTMCKSNLNCRIGTKFLFVSKALAAASCEGSAFDDRVEVLYNPIAVGRFSGGSSLRAPLKLAEDAPVVGALAQICQRKGIDVLIETAELVLKTMPDTRFLVAGPDGLGEERFASEMRQMVQDKGLGGKVLFLGPLDNVADFLATLDVFFLPTRSEPFGMVFVEAMAAKVPVVATRVGGIPEIIPSKEYGFTLDLDAERFTDAILMLLTDPGLRKSIAEAGYQRAREEFDQSIFHKKLKDLYLEALGL